MQESVSQKIQKLRNILKNKIKGNIADIFIIGSSIKNKLIPRDFDLIVLFREKSLKEAEERLFDIKESLKVKDLHVEPLFADEILEEGIIFTILHEGFSVKKNMFLYGLTKLNSYSIFSFTLGNLSKINKVRFAQTLYGRNKDGLLYNEKGISLGQGSFMVPIEREEIFKELMGKWEVKYKYKKAFVKD